jgi:hypothetical protein
MNVMGEFITGGVLVSAYDIHYEMISARALKFAETVFLDSGGYEARIDHDLSETYGRPYKPKSWAQPRYRKVLNEWKLRKPTIVVSFDSPKKYLSAKQQIKEALRLRDRYPDLLFELILKPDTKHSTIVPMERLIKQVKELRSFAAVGFSEKELDPTLMGRMKKIARLRLAMDEAGVGIPIHVFGSLDTLSTPLYFISGAEIFDGLTWLRFGFHNGITMYEQNYGPLRMTDGLLRKVNELSHEMWKNNYYYLENLKAQMINYTHTGNFGEFKYVGTILEEAYQQLQASISKVR